MTGRSVHIRTALLCAAVLSGCAGTRPYESASDRNVRFDTAVESGSWVSSVRASVHVHSVDRDCRTTYEGTIPLKNPTVVTGFPAGRMRYMVIAFNSSSFLLNRRSSIDYSTILTPRDGYDYEVAVRYRDDTYDASVVEVNRGNGTRRKLRHRPLQSCRGIG